MNKKREFYITIIDGLKHNLMIKDIAKIMNMSHQNLSKTYLPELVKNNVVEKIGRAWRVNEKEVNTFFDEKVKLVIEIPKIPQEIIYKKCQVDPSHPTFYNSKEELFVEEHHLIPSEHLRRFTECKLNAKENKTYL